MKPEATRPGATRVRFRERQVLRASDLAAEQAYLVTARRRHNIGHHGWGIVVGLRLTTTPAGIVVEPGMAVDGYGRELVINQPLALPPDAFDTLKAEALDVWLAYDPAEGNLPQRGSWDCGPGRNTRTREQSSVRLTAAGQLDPRSPVEVPLEDLAFPPHETPPDSPAREWPVYLGTIGKTTLITPGAPDPNWPRPYATLKGESVAAPSGRARMQVGSELESDARRFAVSVADADGKLVERLAVDRDGNTVVTGNTAITNRPGSSTRARRLLMRENKAPAAPGEEPITEPLCAPPLGPQETPGAARLIHFLPLAATPAAAAPWQLYRTSVKEGDRTLQQLRVELKHPGKEGDPTLYRLTVGTRDAAGVFKACFTVAADCTVTVEGAVNVNGQLIRGPVRADPSDPRFAAEVAKQWALGTAIGEAQTGQLFSGVNSGDLNVSITSLQSQSGSQTPQSVPKGSSILSDEVLLYGFALSNRGSGTITNIQLYVNLTFDGVTTSEKLPATPFNLAIGEARIITPAAPFNPRGTEGRVEISVTAVGVGPQPNVVAATDSAAIEVVEPIP